MNGEKSTPQLPLFCGATAAMLIILFPLARLPSEKKRTGDR